MSFALFFKKTLAKCGKSRRALAAELGYSAPAISQICTGRHKPPLDRMPAWAEALGLTGAEREEFLLLARLEHTPPEIRDLALKARAEANRILDANTSHGTRVAGGVLGYALDAGAGKGARSQPSGLGLPVVGTVTAGDGWALATDDGVIVTRDGLAAVRVQGSSAEPFAMDGQYVIADPNRTGDRIPLDAVVVVQTPDHKAYCKRWAGIHDGKMVLVSINQGRGSVVRPAEGAIAWQVVGVLFPEAITWGRGGREAGSRDPGTGYDMESATQRDEESGQ